MSENVEMLSQKQFLAQLKYFAANQKLWEKLFPCDPASDIEKEFETLFIELCKEGRYDLALQAVYACRSGSKVTNALTKVFVELLQEKIEREGVESARELFITAFSMQK